MDADHRSRTDREPRAHRSPARRARARRRSQRASAARAALPRHLRRQRQADDRRGRVAVPRLPLRPDERPAVAHPGVPHQHPSGGERGGRRGLYRAPRGRRETGRRGDRLGERVRAPRHPAAEVRVPLCRLRRPQCHHRCAVRRRIGQPAVGGHQGQGGRAGVGGRRDARAVAVRSRAGASSLMRKAPSVARAPTTASGGCRREPAITTTCSRATPPPR